MSMSRKKPVAEEGLEPSKIRSESIPCLSWKRWTWVAFVSLLVGGVIYGTATSLAYFLASWTAENTPAKLFDLPKSSVPEITIQASDAGELFARSLGIEFPSADDEMRKSLTSAFTETDAPILLVASNFLRSGESKKCEPLVRERMNVALARLLVGWPGDISIDLTRLEEIVYPKRIDPAKSPQQLEEETDAQCDAYAKELVLLPAPTALLWGRTNPLTSRDLAVRVLGTKACLPGGSGDDAEAAYTRCRILQGLLDSAASADSVKHRRMWVNFFWGWERFAVIVLFVAIVLAMRELRRQRQPLVKQAKEITERLRLVEFRLSQIRDADNVSEAKSEALKLYEDYSSEFGVPYDEKKHKNSPKDGKCVADADGLCLLKDKSPTALRDLLDANRECVGSTQRGHLEKLVELHTQALARQRAFINALITAFPAIGLVATLHGLIVALSRASGIVAGSEADRFSATELVTGILSSSFATTMLALTAMALCMLCNTREEHLEADLLEDTHRRLNAVFWPGRP
jgi:hypothetical protein